LYNNKLVSSPPQSQIPSLEFAFFLVVIIFGEFSLCFFSVIGTVDEGGNSGLRI
jgi:hypothetical protein